MKKEWQIAFQKTIPVLAGYLPIGIAYGILMQNMGYGVLWAALVTTLLYTGSMQFVLLEFLSGGASLLTVAVTTLLVNSRHLFYGLSFIDAFKAMRKKRLYMIHSMTDETYSLLCSYEPTEGIDNKKTMFLISLFNQGYFLLGTVLGSLAGNLIPFDTMGIDFAMTALFTVIFVEQWQSMKNHIPACTGIIVSILCLIVFGPSNFILPAMILSVALLLGLKNQIRRANGKEEGTC